MFPGSGVTAPAGVAPWQATAPMQSMQMYAPQGGVVASLKARQKAVEDLQIDRNVPVHVLNELVKQVPEGIYSIASFNPESHYHLALGISYPNQSDRIRSHVETLGGSIMSWASMRPAPRAGPSMTVLAWARYAS